jgi:hypothetical protein
VFVIYFSQMSIFEFQRGLTLAEINIEISHGDHSRSYPCKVYFDLNQDNPILIEPLEPVTAITHDPDVPFSVVIPNANKPIECYTVFASQRWGGDQSGVWVILAPRFSNIELDRSSILVRINAGVLNLGHYWTDMAKGLSYFNLAADGWQFEFTPVTELTLVYPPLVQSSSYFFTHHLCATKSDGSSFSTVDAHDKLSDLAIFFSFCHGHWVSTALTYGIDEHGNVGMEQWGTHKVSRWCRGSNWLDEHYGSCMAQLFPGFMQLLAKSPDWKNAIQIAIYWYIRADTNLTGPDGGCILLQAALERLAWHVLVRDRCSLSEDGFSKLPTADRLRLLLSALSIPLDLPPGLIELSQTAKAFGWRDGPQAFVETRNQIIHPPKHGRRIRGSSYYDAYRMAKWYLELIILSACGYNGVYSNQTRKERWIGQVDPVPWKV